MPDFVGFKTKRCDRVIFNATLSLPPPGKSADQKVPYRRLASEL